MRKIFVLALAAASLVTPAFADSGTSEVGKFMITDLTDNCWGTLFTGRVDSAIITYGRINEYDGYIFSFKVSGHNNFNITSKGHYSDGYLVASEVIIEGDLRKVISIKSPSVAVRWVRDASTHTSYFEGAIYEDFLRYRRCKVSFRGVSAFR